MARSILIIEDDVALGSLFENIANTVAEHVVLVGTRKEAVDRLSDSEFDLVIADLHLPDGDVLDVIEVCCEHELDVIVVSSDDEYIHQSADMGVLAYLMKPVSASDLMTAITDIGSLDMPGSYIAPRARG